MTTSPPAAAQPQGAPAGARNHHYVPQCYLKGFARSRSKNAQLYVVDAAHRRAFTTTPRNVAAQRDFNRIEVLGHDPNLIETRYAEFEARLAPMLVRLDAAGDFANQDDLHLALELVGLLAVRNPRQREQMRRFHADVARRVMDLALATPERWASQVRQAQAAGHLEAVDVPYAEMREFVEQERYEVEVPTTRHVHQELQMLEALVPLLRQRSWCLLRAGAQSGGFVTSDHPVTLRWNDPALAGGFYGPGYGLSDTSVVCPLSHQLALLGTFDGRSGALELSDSTVAAVNSLTIGHAASQIYAQSDRFFYADTDGAPQRGNTLLDVLLVKKRP
ncbi:DUF4238 domain-containing protein [Ralstonia pseudosolanacearum]|uniref:DUF4238 domain-containing protein n=1 Tax=Ralstonia pseudosolanacearum TaxID=1310165 RepID=UPI0008D9AE26|nr:DUF4238 domain-containing protein [Ralstonia pseudosolanacearum]MCL1622608.1 DUF4238 domain-containing protein [Ralstonia pseudosolanacearum CaRs-Mep]